MKKYNKLKTLATLAVLATAGIYLINRAIFFICSLKDALPSKNSNTYQWRFGNIFYTKQGNGSPILLIHQINSGSNELVYRDMIQPLAKHHTVYTIDLIGCGRSDKPKITYTSYLFVQLINDFIKNVIQQKTDVIAAGNTCSIVVQACNMEKDNFNKLLFINPDNMSASKQFPGRRKMLLKYLLECPIFGTFTYNIIHAMPMVEHRFYKKYYQNPSNVRASYVNAYYNAAHLGGSRCRYLYASLKSGYINCNLMNALKNTDHSIYLAISQNIPDAHNTLEQYQVINPSIEGSFLHNTKYLPQLEDPESLLNICRIFF